MRSFIRAEKHHQFRRTPEELGLANLNEKFQSEGVPAVERSARMLKALLEAECPIIIEGERIVATRTITSIPSIFTDAEWAEIRSKHTLHERGTVSNLSPDYEGIIADGLEKRKAEVVARLEDATLSEEQKLFLEAARDSIEAVQAFILKYKECAEKAGLTDVAEVLGAIHTEGAKTLHEALQLLRIVHFALWESDCYHNTLGRFDQYIYPYYKSDIESGRLTDEEAYELIMEFFLMCNKDSDLYVGMQQGDNGQSLVLGGRDEEGNCLFNEVSRMCLKASYELNLIDPKINLRCDANTPLDIYKLGAELTKR
ncbi:MAG: pyruvate formate-lyase, partial [Alistipes sp.]|nr:pyruvate formate-lyase [Alistipes sp.]